MAVVELAPPRHFAASVEDVLRDLGGGGRLVHVERFPSRPARWGELAVPLRPEVGERLPFDGLWSHQAAAIDLLRARRSVAVATGTASGKSLCYQLPIAESVADPVHPGTALLVFPTKALARDQLRALVQLDLPRMVVAAYDGDCDNDERNWARRHANVVLTNPEMLHHGLLPHHGRWATFLMRLRYVVVDEMHTFRGVFGSHMAHVLRRLRRLSAAYGSEPTFVCCSATIGAPAELASALTGVAVHAVTDDGSPRGERVVALWDPPRGDGAGVASGRARRRPSPHGETAALMTALVRTGRQTIVFCRSRRGAEVVAADVRRRLPDEYRHTVAPYRGGFLAAERREIESDLLAGRLRGVVTTNALELGVDIGSLDACILDGFPGTIASMWQQMGRAGREGQHALAVLVAGEDQLDQWLLAHPTEVFRRGPEPAVINPANPHVLQPHLACAAYEKPLTHADERFWPGLLDDGVRALVQADRLKVRPPPARAVPGRRHSPAAVWSGRGYPAHGVGLRSTSSLEYRITTVDGELVGTVDDARAFELVHPGAVYLHHGASYRVLDLDCRGQVAVVALWDGGEYTVARTDLSITIVATDISRDVGRAQLSLGPVEVSSRVVGYQRRDAASGEVVATVSLDLPATRLSTRAFWYTVGPSVLDRAALAPSRWPGILHAVEHAAIGLLPLFTICDRWDVGGVSTAGHPGTGQPTVFVYDGYVGGAGIAELGFRAADRHLAATGTVIEACDCATGCPSCVQSPKCGNLNEPLDKDGAAALLRAVLT
ncbi:MAG: DEAD/DEAH box helicase [Acidimicrobiia bacterium]